MFKILFSIGDGSIHVYNILNCYSTYDAIFSPTNDTKSCELFGTVCLLSLI